MVCLVRDDGGRNRLFGAMAKRQMAICTSSNVTSEAYDEGTAAYRRSPDRLDNPYAIGSPAYNDFERGWTQECKRSGPQVGTRKEIGWVPFQTAKPPTTAWSPSTEPDPEQEKKRAAQAYAKATGR